MRICRIFSFDAAHFIPNHKGCCKNLHGHTYTLEVVIDGAVMKDGMVLDFAALKDIVQTEVIDKLDHQSLNTLFENPTAEHIVEWIAARLKGKLPVCSLKVWEGQGKWVELIVS